MAKLLKQYELVKSYSIFADMKMVSVNTLKRAIQDESNYKKYGVTFDQISEASDNSVYYKVVKLFELAANEPDWILNKSIMSLMVAYLNVYCLRSPVMLVYVKHNLNKKYLLPRHGIAELCEIGYIKVAEEIKRLDPDHCAL